MGRGSGAYLAVELREGLADGQNLQSRLSGHHYEAFQILRRAAIGRGAAFHVVTIGDQPAAGAGGLDRKSVV